MNVKITWYRKIAWLSAAVALYLSHGSALAWLNKAETAQIQAMQAKLEEVAGVEPRVARLEQLMDASNVQQMYLKLQSIEQENRELRGLLEEVNHRLERMADKQRELNLDMDKRIQSVEGNTMAPPVMMGAYGGSSTEDMAQEPPQVGSVQDEQSLYSQAFEYLKSGQNSAAKDGFAQFLASYPESVLASNAQYWLGESNYSIGDYDEAAKSFAAVFSNYPGTPKVADAYLKAGYSYYELKQWSKARVALEKVVKEYPLSSVARQAKSRLDRMKREKH